MQSRFFLKVCRENYEMAVSKPQVIFKEIDGVKHEPYENLTLDLDEKHQGSMIELLNMNNGQLTDMIADGKGRVRLDYVIPSKFDWFPSNFLDDDSGLRTLLSALKGTLRSKVITPILVKTVSWFL